MRTLQRAFLHALFVLPVVTALPAFSGGGASLVTRGERIHIPAETILEFRLQQPVRLPRS